MSNQQYNKNINEPIIGSTRDTATFPAGSAKPGQNEPVGSHAFQSTQGSQGHQSMGAKLDSAINQAGQSSSSQTGSGFDNLHQKHPIWSDQASKTGSDQREGLGSQSNQPSYTDSSYHPGQGNLGSQKDWTDTSAKVGSDQRENLGAFTTSSHPSSTTGSSLSQTYGISSDTHPSITGTSLSQNYGSSSTHPSTMGTSLSQDYGSSSTHPSSTTGISSDTEHKDYHVSDQSKHDESKTSSHTDQQHKPTVTEKIKEKIHHTAEKMKEAFT